MGIRKSLIQESFEAADDGGSQFKLTVKGEPLPPTHRVEVETDQAAETSPSTEAQAPAPLPNFDAWVHTPAWVLGATQPMLLAPRLPAPELTSQPLTIVLPNPEVDVNPKTAVLSVADYALLSAHAYGLGNLEDPGSAGVIRSAQNTLPLPEGWSVLDHVDANDAPNSSGFLAGVYGNGNRIVISFAGTTAETNNSLFSPASDWFSANLPAGFGLSMATQIEQAANLYLEVQKGYPDADISFTGHSLGGGLASLMGLFFDREATVFDAAPFKKSADSVVVVSSLIGSILIKGDHEVPQELTEFLSAISLPVSSYLGREQKLTTVTLKDEILSWFAGGELGLIANLVLQEIPVLVEVALLSWSPLLAGPLLYDAVDLFEAIAAPITGESPWFFQGGTNIVVDTLATPDNNLNWGLEFFGLDLWKNPTDLHSITLLTGTLQSEDFLIALRAHPELLPSLFANPDYANDPTRLQANLLDMLVQRQVIDGNALDQLAEDVMRIDLDAGLTSFETDTWFLEDSTYVSAILNRVILAGLYEQGHQYGPNEVGLPMSSVLKAVPGAVTFDLADLGEQAARIFDDLGHLIDIATQWRGPGLDAQNFASARWVVQAGEAALSYTLPTGIASSVILGYDGDDTLTGGTGADLIAGGKGSDTLIGGAGSDTLVALGGDDMLNGGADSDTYLVTRVFDTLGDPPVYNLFDFQGSRDTLTIGDLPSLLYGFNLDEFEDLVFLRSGTTLSIDLDLQYGLAVDDNEGRIVISNQGVAENAIETLLLLDSEGAPLFQPISLVSAWSALLTYAEGTEVRLDLSGLMGQYGLLVNTAADAPATDGGTGSDLWFYGTNRTPTPPFGADSLVGTAGNDTFVISTGDDTIVGGTGTDTLVGDLDLSGQTSLGVSYYLGSGWVSETSSYNAITTGLAGAATRYILRLGDYADETDTTGIEQFQINLTGTTRDDLLIWQNSTRMHGGAGNDAFYANWSALTTAVVWNNDPNATVTVNNTSLAGLERLVISTGAGADRISNLLAQGNDEISTGTGNDMIASGAGNDTLDGGAGSDTLDGGEGSDRMVGGDGDDVYYVDNTGDQVIESNSNIATGGNDWVYSSVTHTLAANVENLRLTGSGATNGSGSAGNNTLLASAGDNVLDGLGGIDTLLYSDAATGVTVNLALTTAQSTGGSGIDTIRSFENLGGSAYADQLTGSNGANMIDGGAGNDTLAGGGGVDTLAGGLGDDSYVYDGTDLIVELPGEGIDEVQASASHILGAHLENLRLLGAAAINATGNESDNVLFANAGDNVLDGSAGNDTASYAQAETAVTVSLLSTAAQTTGGSGSDTLLSIENLTGSTFDDSLSGNGTNNLLTGAAGSDYLDGLKGNDTLEGGDGDDTLVGGAGNDTLIGGAGNDVYALQGADAVLEDLGAGIDEVRTSGSYGIGANIENVRLQGTGNPNVSGNGLNNIIHANVGNNVLNGAGGVDTVSYYFAGSAVTVSLSVVGAQATGGSGSDTLSNFENLTGSGYNDLLEGNGGNNVLDGQGGNDTIIGGSGNDTLLGGGGNDTLQGGIGSDVYVLQGADMVVELAGEGIDEVQVSGNATLGENVENLRLLGTGNAIGNGNSLNNTITGNSGNNTLTGGAGSDVLTGADGNDTLTGGSGNDTFVLDSLVGSETITDFVTGVDKLRIDQITIPVGDGDAQVEGVTTVSGPGGFAASAELVIVSKNIVGAINNASAAAAIGSAGSTYALGQTALFLVDNGTDSALYLFGAQDSDAAVEAGELTMLASLVGQATVSASDVFFGP